MAEEKKKRTLSAAEQKRLAQFEKISEELQAQGYVRHDLIVSIGKANAFAVVFLIPLFVIGYGLCMILHHQIDYAGIHPVLFLLILVLVVVHELIHGISWSLFTPHGFRDIEFGFIRSSLTPYCTCLAPLKKYQHIFGTAMPMIVLGIIPMIIGIISGNVQTILLGIIMTDSAAGDIMIIHRLLQYKAQSPDAVYMDHPTEAGCTVFDKQ